MRLRCPCVRVVGRCTKQNKEEDIRSLVDSFTAPALATALRDREETLHIAAQLLKANNLQELAELLHPYERQMVDSRRQKKRQLNITGGFTKTQLTILQKYLHRMPRQVSASTRRRASVVVPLCNVNGVASVLFERRSSTVRAHKNQVCFPGGMVDEGIDQTVIETSLREMSEELGIPQDRVDVLGILRCNWTEVASITGVAVTPVVGFIGELSNLQLKPNPDEVQEYFTVPLKDLLNRDLWVIRDFSAPVFTGGPYVIWGLTAYLLDRFLQDVLLKCDIVQ